MSQRQISITRLKRGFAVRKNIFARKFKVRGVGFQKCVVVPSLLRGGWKIKISDNMRADEGEGKCSDEGF